MEKIQITNIMNEKEDIIADPTAIKRIIREHYKQLYAHKFDSLEEINSSETINYQNSIEIK